MSKVDRRANRVTLAKLLDDDTIRDIAERIPASEDVVREGVLGHTQFVMEAKVVNYVPTIVEKNVKEALKAN